MVSNEKRWELFVKEVAEAGLIWTLEKDGQYVTSPNRYGSKCFPWWSSRERVLKQISVVPAYSGYRQAGFEWSVFINEWVPSLRNSQCLLGINYEGKNNLGFDLPIAEVIQAISLVRNSSKDI